MQGMISCGKARERERKSYITIEFIRLHPKEVYRRIRTKIGEDEEEEMKKRGSSRGENKGRKRKRCNKNGYMNHWT
jgi:hypothetical protein